MKLVTSPPVEDNSQPIPPATIIVLAFVGYLILLLFGICIRNMLRSCGFCSSCHECGKEDEKSCCSSCLYLVDKCNYKITNFTQCCNFRCPSKNALVCEDLFACTCLTQCCHQSIINGCTPCALNCRMPNCSVIKCFCCEISFRSTR